jgi:hypothetical protein
MTRWRRFGLVVSVPVWIFAFVISHDALDDGLENPLALSGVYATALVAALWAFGLTFGAITRWFDTGSFRVRPSDRYRSAEWATSIDKPVDRDSAA